MTTPASEIDQIDLGRLTWEKRKGLCIAACALLGMGTVALPWMLWGAVTNDAALITGCVSLGLSLLVALPAACFMAFMQKRYVGKLKKLQADGLLAVLPNTPLSEGMPIGDAFNVIEVSAEAFAIGRRGGKVAVIIESSVMIVAGVAMLIGTAAWLANFGLIVQGASGVVSVKATLISIVMPLTGLGLIGAALLPRVYQTRITPQGLVMERLALVGMDQPRELSRAELSRLEIDQYNAVHLRTTSGRALHVLSCGTAGYAHAFTGRPNAEMAAYQKISDWRVKRAAAMISRVWGKTQPIEARRVERTLWGSVR